MALAIIVKFSLPPEPQTFIIHPRQMTDKGLLELIELLTGRSMRTDGFFSL